MAEQPGKNKVKNNTSFRFVTYQQPGYQKNAKARAQVRSHVSRWQHHQARERLWNAAVSEAGASSSASSTPSRFETATRPTDASSERTSSTRESSENSDHAQPSIDTTETEGTICSPEARRLGTNAWTKSFSQGTMSFRTITLQDSENVFGRSLDELRLELPSVMRLYKNMSERQSLDFVRQYGEGSGGRFYGLVFTDPILLSTALLVGVRNQLDVQGRSLKGKTLIGVLHIERYLMRRINEALRDPVRGFTDQMLLAVGLCAAYEIKHGNGACFHIHMRGLVQMINMRGGLLAIGTPDPYVLRVLFWLDINTTKLAGCKPYFEDMADSLKVNLIADPKMFRAKGVANDET